MRKKQPFTLLEIMIVILLIGLIGSVVGYNMKGSLDEGRAFKSEQAIAQIKDILELEFAKDETLDPKIVQKKLKHYLERSGLVKNPDKILQDGWGNAFTITIDANKEVTVESARLNDYKQKKKQT
jgi:type II secretory pathway pseudopilin PulG